MPKRIAAILLITALLTALCGCRAFPNAARDPQSSDATASYISVTVSPMIPEPTATPDAATYLAGLTGRETADVAWTMESSNRNSRFYGFNTVDGDASTGWMPRVNDEAPSIVIAFSEPTAIYGIAMLPGDQSSQGAYNASGKPRQVLLQFDDGSTERFELPVTALGEVWIGEFSARSTKAVELFVEAVDGINPFTISELSYLVATWAPSTTLSPNPHATAPPAIPTPVGPGKDITGFESSWFSWEDAGNGLHFSSARHLRAGQWVDADGTTVLYCDYLTSSDLCAYEMIWQGEVVYRDGIIQLDASDPLGGVCQTHKIRFRSVGYGVMDVTNPDDGKTIRLYLVRAKYTQVSRGK